MKRILSVIIAMWGFSLSAQTVIYNADFDSGIPGNMTMIKNPALTVRSNLTQMWGNAGNTVWVPSNYGLIPPTDMLAWGTAWYDPQGIAADDWLITPAITLTENNILSWEDMSVGSNDPYFPYDIKISTATIDTADFQLLGTFYGQNQRPDDEVLDLSAYANQTVYIAVHNHAFEQFLITIDSITVTETVGEEVALFNTNITGFAEEGVNQFFTIEFWNRGYNAITSLNINYQIDNDPIITEPITGLSLNLLDSLSLSFTTPWTPVAAGTNNIVVWVSDINGTSVNSNTMAIPVTVLQDHFVQRKTLIEDFSSASCIPCKGFNINRLGPILHDFGANKTNGQITAIKYQMNFPTPGADPSYNSDSQARYDFYGVGGIPTPVLDGMVTTSSLSALINYAPITNQLNQPAYISLDVAYTVTDSIVDVNVDVHPHINTLSDHLKLYIAVTEDHYQYTGGTNGETEFHHIMRKMLPNANGISLGTLTADSIKSFSETYSFTIGNVTLHSFNIWEDMDNISVIAFVQDTVTQEIYQSGVGGCTHTPALTQVGPIYSSVGDSVLLSCNTSPSFTYQWELNGIVIPGATSSIYYAQQSGNYTVMITENGCSEYSQGIDLYFITGVATPNNTNSLNVYPNPSTGLLTIEGVEGTTEIYDIYGRLVLTTNVNTLDITHFTDGIYFVRAVDRQGRIYSQKVIKQ